MKTALVLSVLTLAAAGASAADRVLTQTDELRQIVRSGRREGWNFNVSGTVLAVLRNNRIVVEDDAGRFCFFNCRADELPKPGDVVGVRGYLINANTRRDELLTDGDVRIERRGATRPVRTLDVPAARLTDPELEMKRVRVEGLLVNAAADETDPRWEILELKDGAQTVLAFFRPGDGAAPTSHAALAGARIAVTGICFRHLSGTRRFIGPYVEVAAADDIATLVPPPDDPFDAPPLETFGAFNAAEIAAMDRRQVVGTVLATWLPNRACLAEDDGNPVTVSFADATPLPTVGTRIRVCGYPDTDLYTIRLALARWRAEPGEVHAPETAEPSGAARLFLDHGRGDARGKAALHGKLLALEGTIVAGPADLHAAGRYRLATPDGPAALDFSTRPEAAAGLAAGCRVRVTGLCLYETEERGPRNPLPKLKESLLVVRSAADVAVLAPPPWWTIRRLFALICILAAAAAALFVRTALLKRRTRLRVEERTRLAVELHDSLSQNLAAASFEVSAARAAQACDPPGAAQHLETADRMLRSSRTQLKQCLWDLRSDTLAEPDFSKSVLKTVLTVAEDSAVHVRFNVPRARLDDPTAHTVLSILRELVSNAVRHGAAKSVRIAGVLSDGSLAFSVTDDGRVEAAAVVRRRKGNMSNRKIRIVLADDHSLLRMGLVSLLGYQRDLEVVGQAEDGHQAVDLAERLRPDLVIMDLMMPVLSGADATAKIRAAHPETKVLVLTSFGTSADLVRAVRSGATGALLKDAPNEELLAAIREVAAGHTAYSRDVRQQLRAAEDQPDLTDRQRAILAAAARGLTTDNIATELRISVDGVKKHFSAIFQKLGASSRSEAVAIALRHNLLEKE